MSSSTAKFVPTLGGRVWRLQRQSQGMQAAVKNAVGGGSSSSSSSPFSQGSAATYSTSSSSTSSWSHQGQRQGSSWAQR